MRLAKRTRTTAVFVALSLFFASVVPAAWADEVPEWPSEQEQVLKSADKQLLDVQRARFRARFFGKDKEDAKKLDKQFKELQKERNSLLQAMGRR
jgi:hypothetical protein